MVTEQVHAEYLPGGKYEIVKRGGRGGTGEVFCVCDRRLQKVWAAKRVKKECPGMEAMVLGKVFMDCFPRIVDLVEDEACRYLIMDWIEGETLQEKLQREGAIAEEEAIRIGLALCDAIGALHRMQPPLLYLDCKPSNVMMDQNGKLWLIDFGSALENAEAEVEPLSGSFGYAAPEQLGVPAPGRRADVRSDVYGLGRTLYALLGGMDPAKPPYGACPLSDCDTEISSGLIKIVEKCTRESPTERFQTMDAVKNALKKLKDQKNNNPARKFAKSAMTWLLLGMTFGRALIFYGVLYEPGAGTFEKLFALFWIVLFAAVAYLWQHFAVEKMRHGRKRWEAEPLQSVQRTEKKEGRWLAGLFLCVCISVWIQADPIPQAVRLPLILRDVHMRKLLVKDGYALQSSEPVFMELDPALFEADREMEICVTATAKDGGCVQEYRFLYTPCNSSAALNCYCTVREK